MAIKKSFIQIQKEIKEVSNNTLIINLKETDNFNSNSIVVFTHICGYSFKSKLGNMLSGRNNLCPKCEKSSRVKPTEELLQLIKEKGCELIDKEQKVPLIIRNKYLFKLSCSCVEKRSLSNILNNTQDKISCTNHRDKVILNLKDIQERLSSFKYGSFTLLSKEWFGYKASLKTQCNYCNNISSESLSILKNREGKCKNCFGSINSIKEVYCNILLTDLEIKFISQYYIDKYPFDFYLPEYNTLIEIDGKQHVTSTFKGKPFKNNDQIKNELALKNGIEILRINEKQNLTKTILDFVQRPSKA